MFGDGQDVQWERYAKVEFQNFETGLNTSIDALRIQAKYRKTIDESKDTSNGEVKVYGLTEKTFKILGERLQTEITLYAGYQKSQLNSPRKLFKAVMMDKTFEVTDGVSVATFKVLGDFVKKNIGDKVSTTLVAGDRLLNLIMTLAEYMGYDGVMSIPDLPQAQALADFFSGYRLPFGYAVNGTPKEALKKVCKAYALQYNIVDSKVIFTIDDYAIDFYTKLAAQVQGDVKAAKAVVADNKTTSANAKPVDKGVAQDNTQVKPPTFDELNKSQAILFNNDTGLIGTPKIKTIETKVAYDQALRDGESIKSIKTQKVRVNKKGEIMKDKEGNVKLTKKPEKKSVFRRQAEARIYINASVLPQTHVILETINQVADGTYKVRSVDISLDTEGEEWFMDLVLNE